MTMIFFTWCLLLAGDKKENRMCEFDIVSCRMNMHDIKSTFAYLIARALWQPFVHVERKPALRSLVP
jgi:hypothetical protein